MITIITNTQATKQDHPYCTRATQHKHALDPSQPIPGGELTPYISRPHHTRTNYNKAGPKIQVDNSVHKTPQVAQKQHKQHHQ